MSQMFSASLILLMQAFLQLKFQTRLFAILVITIVSLSLFGCGVKDKVNAPTLLAPVKDANTEQLVAEVNRIAELKSIRGKVDIIFEDTSFAQLGLSEKYRRADGTVVVQRPEKINLKIQAPFIGTNIAEMTSDGEHFRVAVLQGDQKYRRFLKGTNNAEYPAVKTDESKDNQKKKDEQTVSVLSNVRPQHFTDALLLKPIKPRTETGFVYSQSEIYLDEQDTRINRKKKDGRVMRAYYLLDELKTKDDGTLKVVRRFWFDRVDIVRLARVQNYNKKGEIVSDVVYGPQVSFGENAIKLPIEISVIRLKENYKLSFKFQTPEAVSLNDDYPIEAFLLENRWNLPEVDLDKRSE